MRVKTHLFLSISSWRFHWTDWALSFREYTYWPCGGFLAIFLLGAKPLKARDETVSIIYFDCHFSQFYDCNTYWSLLSFSIAFNSLSVEQKTIPDQWNRINSFKFILIFRHYYFMRKSKHICKKKLYWRSLLYYIGMLGMGCILVLTIPWKQRKWMGALLSSYLRYLNYIYLIFIRQNKNNILCTVSEICSSRNSLSLSP